MAWNPECKTVSDSHTWVGKGLVSFLQHFQLLFLHHKKSVLFIIHMTISTLLILAVRRVHVIHEPYIWPS